MLKGEVRMRKNPDKVDRKGVKFEKPSCYGYYSECSACYGCGLLVMCADMTQYLVKTNQDYKDMG